jgi:hypothetical protein
VIQQISMYKKIILVFLCVCIQGMTHAQTRLHADHSNAWLMYFGTHSISAQWSIHMEGQWRRSDWVRIPQQLLLRTGLNYQVNPSLRVSAGYCFVETYPYGDFPVSNTFPEHRIWEQAQTQQKIGKLEWINRYRLEQRFMYPNGGVPVYQNRFRYLTRISVPFKGKEIKEGSWYVSGYNESMVSFGKQVKLNVFDQNRTYLALGHHVPGLGRLELGYLYQIILKPDGVRQENNHTLQVGLMSNLRWR